MKKYNYIYDSKLIIVRPVLEVSWARYFQAKYINSTWKIHTISYSKKWDLYYWVWVIFFIDTYRDYTFKINNFHERQHSFFIWHNFIPISQQQSLLKFVNRGRMHSKMVYYLKINDYSRIYLPLGENKTSLFNIQQDPKGNATDSYRSHS